MTRRVLITGAASGIGAAVARRLAGPDVRLFLHTRKSEAALAAVASEARASGAHVDWAFSDLAEAGAGAGLVAKAADVFGGLDQVVANAGFAQAGGIEATDRGQLDASHAAMTGAFFEIASAAVPHLKKSDTGRVVAVSSFVAHVFDAERLFAASAAAKAGVEALVRTLARELAADGVTVNAVVPGYTQKDAGGHSSIGDAAWERAAKRTPTGRIATPDDVAALVAFLLSDDAGQITGQAIHVDGGLGLGT